MLLSSEIKLMLVVQALVIFCPNKLCSKLTKLVCVSLFVFSSSLSIVVNQNQLKELIIP